MDDALVVEVLDGLGDRLDYMRRVSVGASAIIVVVVILLALASAHSLLVVAAPFTDSVKELAANAQVGDEVEVVHRLKVVDEGDDAAVSLRYPLQGCNLVSYHVLSALHELL